MTVLRVWYHSIVASSIEVRSEADSQTERIGTEDSSGRRRFKLPLIELKKFGGEIRDWLTFWGQFRKIDEDSNIDDSDKFQYLIQATIPGSRARKLVESYPPIAENYSKAIEGLKSRYGRDELQIEVYVRELLKMILSNAASSDTTDISVLYDKLETQLRALNTLGITTNACAPMLFPLVESCLPTELLRAWQRSSKFSKGREGGEDGGSAACTNVLKGRLDGLMDFLRSEVENEERIDLAAEGFRCLSVENTRHKKEKTKALDHRLPTAAALISCEVAKCVFCNDNKHGSENCFKAQKWTLEQKKKVLSDKKACFRCLKIGHQSRRCREPLRCVLCGGSHVVLICHQLPIHKSDSSVRQNPSLQRLKEKVQEKDEIVMANHTSTHVMLQTLRVHMYGDNGVREVRAIIDTGSQRSYVLKTTVEALHYEPKRAEKIVHVLFGGSKTAERHKFYDIRLGSKDESFRCTFEALDQTIICSGISPVHCGVWTEEMNQLGIKLNDVVEGPIELLIGADVAGMLYTGHRHVLKCGLVAVGTFLGWTIMGKVPGTRSPTTSTSILSLFVKDDITKLWQLDVLGITSPSERQTEQETALAAKEHFNETVTVDIDGRYEVKLPWVPGHPPLGDNYNLAMKRLQSTVKKLKADKRYAAYNEIFLEWEGEGIIEQIESTDEYRLVHYLPHRPVLKIESLTTKIRPVFDASAHEKDKPSLNHCLEKGTNLIELIPQILLRFRKERIGATSDIRKAFLQVGVNAEDRDYLRFLWQTPDGSVVTYRHRRVVFGICSGPFLLGATIEHHLVKYLKDCDSGNSKHSKDTIIRLSKSFYVDNCVTSVPSEEVLDRFMREASILMNERKFDLRGWEYTGRPQSFSDNAQVLGLSWNPSSDTLSLSDTPSLNDKDVVTKRLILSLAQRVFDPIGFTSPATLCPKLMLQRTWAMQIAWDAPVDPATSQEFGQWFEELPLLMQIKIPRWIKGGPDESSHHSLHTFCDASKYAYAVVVFLRVETSERVHVFLIQAKARVAPLKGMTIPRLELMAATIAARLHSSILQCFDEPLESYFWSDSATTLAWIRQTDTWATFVWNRVEEIRSLTDVKSWRHVPGIVNPADLPSRGCSAKRLLESKWWEGPRWLYGSPDTWPREDELQYDEYEVNNERKKTGLTSLLNTTSDNWHFLHFAKYHQTIRMMGWCLRFTHNSRHPNEKKHDDLSVDELTDAERLVLKIVQQETFFDDERIKSLKSFKDDQGLLRLKTRISRREDTVDFRMPIILPSKHPVVDRLIREVHEDSCHMGIQGLMSILRERYWILGGRKTIRNVITKCIVCKRYAAKPVQVETPPLPADRIRDAVAFEVTGVDFAGPLFLKDGKKAWVCLFTCAVYRAVHLELASSLTTEEFLQVLRRFVARRGRPRILYSDNGTNFIGTENCFDRLDWNEICKYSGNQRIVWHFNPPTASWWGGFWERLIGLLKQLLRRVLGRTSLDYEALLTILCDCESVMNSRPLTPVTNDPDDLTVLTPAMFIREQAGAGLPECDEIDKTSLNRKMIYKQKLREDLRKRFRTEYLGYLRNVSSKRSSPPINLGNIVLIGSDNEKRSVWPLGRIVELLPGKDGKTRLVRVKTAKGMLLRPVQRVYILECGNETILSTSDNVAREPKTISRDENQESGVVNTSCKVPAEVNRSSVSSEMSEKSRVNVPKCARVVITRSGRVSKMPKRFID